MAVAEISQLPLPLRDEAQRRERAKRRLYVACQAGGWGALMFVQLAVINATAKKGSGPWERVVLATSLGLLVTHFTRPLLHRSA